MVIERHQTPDQVRRAPTCRNRSTRCARSQFEPRKCLSIVVSCTLGDVGESRSAPVRVLIVDDDVSDRALIAATLTGWAAAQLFGIDEIVDALLLVVGAFTVCRRTRAPTSSISSPRARSRRLRCSARRTARHLPSATILGITAISALLMRQKRQSRSPKATCEFHELGGNSPSTPGPILARRPLAQRHHLPVERRPVPLRPPHSERRG
jgi:hypothetical protein